MAINMYRLLDSRLNALRGTGAKPPVSAVQQEIPNQIQQTPIKKALNKPISQSVQNIGANMYRLLDSRLNALRGTGAATQEPSATSYYMRNLINKTDTTNKVADTRTMPGDREANSLLYGDSGARLVGGMNVQTSPDISGNGKTSNMTPEQQEATLLAATAVPAGEQRDGIQSARFVDPAMRESFKMAMANRPGIERIMPGTGAGVADRAGINPLPQGSGWIRNESSGETVSMDGSGRTTMTDSQGGEINQMSSLIGNVPAAARGGVTQRATGAPQRAGNLDVTFGPDVDQAARERFLRDPVRPTAQIDRYQRRVPSMNASRIINGGGQQQDAPPINTFGDVMRAKRGMAMERLAIQKQDAATQQQRAENQLATDNNRLALDAERNGIERIRAGADVDRNDIDRSRWSADAANNAAKNEIDRLNVTGSNEERNANIAEKQLRIRQQEEIAKLQTAYETAPDEKTKKAIQEKLIARGAMKEQKPEVFFDPQYNSMGEIIGRKPYILENGVVRPALPGGGGGKAPQGAVDEVLKNPKKAKDFMAAYGYLPDGVVLQ